MAKRKKEIKVDFKDMVTVPWSELKTYEFNDLKVGDKETIEQLVNLIQLKGFKFPVHIWADNNYVIDGTGRFHALLELEKQGWKIPDMGCIPVVANDFDEAKELVLMISSQYGKATQESVGNFISSINSEDLNIILENINYSDVDFGDEDPIVIEQDEKDIKQDFKLTVEFETEKDQKELYRDLTDKGFKCKL